VIPLLAPLFPEPWSVYAEGLACAPRLPAGSLLVHDLAHDAALLNDILRRHARHLGVHDGDLRAATSAWSLQYLSALLPPVAAAASVLRHAFPVTAGELALTLHDTGAPERFHMVSAGLSMSDSTTTTHYGPLVWDHLDPLFATLAGVTRLPRKVLWSNAARCLETIFEQLLAIAPGAPNVAADRDLLLRHPQGLGRRINPLYAPERRRLCLEQSEWVLRQVHRHCCLTHRLPGRRACSACPQRSVNLSLQPPSLSSRAHLSTNEDP
jgi:ferric iron reductase protein FhuF